MKKIFIQASRPYDVYVGEGLLQQAGQMIGACLPQGKKCIVVTDSHVGPLYAPAIIDALQQGGFWVDQYPFPAGETSKNLALWGNLLEFLAQKRISRTDFLVALGGGVCGDLTGFAAATYLRGIPYVQIPTTFLAAIDSSVGGKTAVDLKEGKNLVGAFWQPSLVLCDTYTFRTLPSSVFADGIAEGIKYGMIRSKDLFHLLHEPLSQHLEEIIAQCIQIKGDIVEADEFDRGERQLLNFGHTLGHGIEQCSGFSISHGQGVSIGMAAMTRWAAKQGLCSSSVLRDLTELLNHHGLPTKTDLPGKAIFQAALSDKKRSEGKNNVIIPREIGDCQRISLTDEELQKLIMECAGEENPWI